MSQIITTASVQNLTIAQLRALHSQLQRELVQSGVGSRERREALTQLDIVSRALALRHIARPQF